MKSCYWFYLKHLIPFLFWYSRSPYFILFKRRVFLVFYVSLFNYFMLTPFHWLWKEVIEFVCTIFSRSFWIFFRVIIMVFLVYLILVYNFHLFRKSCYWKFWPFMLFILIAPFLFCISLHQMSSAIYFLLSKGIPFLYVPHF